MKHSDLFRAYANDEISATIDKWVKGSRNREVMKDRLVDCMTYEKISEKYDLSVRYVKTLIYRLEDDVYKHL